LPPEGSVNRPAAGSLAKVLRVSRPVRSPRFSTASFASRSPAGSDTANTTPRAPGRLERIKGVGGRRLEPARIGEPRVDVTADDLQVGHLSAERVELGRPGLLRVAVSGPVGRSPG
jgi:hypothetical protein